MMPLQKPGSSRQDYCTPPEFLAALRKRLGIENFHLDVAADKDNTVGLRWFDENFDALREDCSWADGWAFCNPPYGKMSRWVSKAHSEVGNGAWIAMLVPASVGSNWWSTWVDGTAHVLFLNGRLTFVGETAPFPKDCALLLYTPFIKGGYEVWDWRAELD